MRIEILGLETKTEKKERTLNFHLPHPYFNKNQGEWGIAEGACDYLSKNVSRVSRLSEISSHNLRWHEVVTRNFVLFL